VDDEVVGQLVQLVGGDPGLHMLGQHVQHFGRQAPGHPHAFDVGCALDGNRHGLNYPIAS
jgi:hypothetical protein